MTSRVNEVPTIRIPGAIASTLVSARMPTTLVVRLSPPEPRLNETLCAWAVPAVASMAKASGSIRVRYLIGIFGILSVLSLKRRSRNAGGGDFR